MEHSRTKSKKVNLDELRADIADLIATSGCGCCRNDEDFEAAKERLALKLDVPKYWDHSGYDFYQYRRKQ
jgi:hypothetical protein